MNYCYPTPRHESSTYHTWSEARMWGKPINEAGLQAEPWYTRVTNTWQYLEKSQHIIGSLISSMQQSLEYCIVITKHCCIGYSSRRIASLNDRRSRNSTYPRLAHRTLDGYCYSWIRNLWRRER